MASDYLTGIEMVQQVAWQFCKKKKKNLYTKKSGFQISDFWYWDNHLHYIYTLFEIGCIKDYFGINVFAARLDVIQSLPFQNNGIWFNLIFISSANKKFK